MLIFCPNCHNMLRISQVSPGDPSTAALEGRSRLECLTCPYQHILTKQLFERKEITPKQPDDALGGEGAWDNVDKTNVQCPNDKCRNFEAYWYQLQIRSADEPMTAFYKCTKCTKEWRE
ncbi:hypothetical protein PMIN03_003721 [Paraphaeosphaeria minitans]